MKVTCNSIVIVALALLTWGCSNGGGNGLPSRDPAPRTDASPHPNTIKFYVDHGKGPVLLRARPLGEGDMGSQQDAASASEGAPTQAEAAPAGGERLGRVRQAATVDKGLDELDTAETDESNQYVPGTTLLKYALLSCWDNSPDAERTTLTAGRQIDIPWVFPYSEEDWYAIHYSAPIYTSTLGVPLFATCDHQLYVQEALLCAADRLAQLGDSPGTVTWTGLDSILQSGSVAQTPVTVTVPPQNTTDKFIARDMAMNILAHLASLDLRPHQVFAYHDAVGDEDVFESRTCDAWYRDIAEDGVVNVSGFEASWFWKGLHGPNSPYFDYAAVTPQHTTYFDDIVIDSSAASKEVGQTRVKRRAMVLSGAARLLRDLVERSIEDDRAGAERLKASAADPAKGLELFWDGAADNPYNSVRHGMRTLFGRLEIGNDDGEFHWSLGDRQQDDPRCERNSSLGYLEVNEGKTALEGVDSFDAWHKAHYLDIPPKSTAQGALMGQLDRSGVVVPDASLADLPAVRAAVLDEMLLQAAVRAQDNPGIDRSTVSLGAFAQTDVGKALTEQFAAANLRDEDFRFALKRIANAFQLAFPFAPVAPGSARADGGVVEEFSPLSDVNGFVLRGGLPRGEIAGDVYARVGAIQSSSQCGYDGNFEGDNPGYAATFQSAFSLGAAYTRRLGALVGDAEAIGIDSITRFADEAYTEARQWSGGRVTRWGIYGQREYVGLEGFAAEDFGANSLEELGNELVLTLPYAVGADCLAGIRSVCPDQETLDFLRIPATSVTEYAAAPQAGIVTPGLELEFDHIQFSDRQEPMYLVLPKGTKLNGGQGMVLALLSATYSAERNGGDDVDYVTSEIVSPVQRRLANSLFGTAPAARPQRSCGNLPSASLPQDYCIPGTQRDMFVPLANEITSAGTGTEDSWKHYLAVAKEAATKADTLANEMFDLGLQRDIRQEAATAEVGEICGSFPEVDGFESRGGNLAASDEDGAINQCLNEKVVDIVFFREDPFAKLSPADATTQIRNLYCQETNPLPPPFCSKPTGETVTHGSLNIHTEVPRTGASNPDDPFATCRDFATTWDPESHSLDRQRFDAYAESSWAWSAPSYTNALNTTRLVVDPDAQWMLTLSGAPVMGTFLKVSPVVAAGDIPSIWPACEPSCNLKGQSIRSLFESPPAFPLSSSNPLILAQVESAVFYMGALGGSIPAGTITMPVLAADRGATGFTDPAPAPVMYGSGVFSRESDNVHYSLQGDGYQGFRRWDDNDRLAMGDDWAEVDPVFASRRKVGRFLAPWEQKLYDQVDQHPGWYRYLTLSNALIPFGERFPSSGEAGANNEATRDGLYLYLKEVAKDAQDTARCGEQGEAYRLVADAARTNVRPWWGKGDSAYNPIGSRFICLDAPSTAMFQVSNLGGDADSADSGLVATTTLKYGKGAGFSVADAAGGEATPKSSSCFYTSAGCLDYSFTRDKPAECGVADGEPWEVSSGNCAHYPWSGAGMGTGWGLECSGNKPPTCDGLKVHRIAHDRLRPVLCPPNQRLEMFLNRRVADNCDAMTTLRRAMGLSCLSEFSLGSVIPPVPPPIQREEDLAVLQVWLGQYGRIINAMTSVLYVTNVPESVLAAAGSVNQSAATQGEQGKLLLEIGKNLNSVEGRLSDIAGSFRRLEFAVAAARNSIQGAKNEEEQKSLNVAFTELEVSRQIALEEAAQSQSLISGLFGAVLGGASGASGFVSAGGAGVGAGKGAGAGGLGALLSLGTTVFTPWVGAAIGAASAITNAVQESATAGTSVGGLRAEQANLRSQHEAIAAGARNRIESALLTMSIDTDGAYQVIEDSIRGTEDAQATMLQNLASYGQNRTKGTFALAQASGADFFQSNGQTIPLRVNTAYRRQFDILRQRYDRALESAKRSAYLARLAIEERLGTRLDDLSEPLGPLEAPSLWVDDLCSLQGVDYEALRSRQPPATSDTSGGAQGEFDLIKGFADQYIGDYVDRLGEFVEFYNLEHPFREGDDQTILSLREDLGSSQSRCQREARNLLFWSDTLTARADLTEDGPAVGGWRVSACSAPACLETTRSTGLVTTGGALAGPPSGSGSWLHTRARDVVEDFETEVGPAPPSVVYQTVNLRAGQRYVLSWWDIARGATGGPPGGDAEADYVATIYDSSWAGLEKLAVTAQSTPANTWSPRRELSFVAAVDGDHHIAFSPQSASSTTFSVGLGGIQLEVASGESYSATAHEPTTDKRVVDSGDCPVDSPAAFRERFLYRCEDGRCFYELRDPLVIDTEVLSQRFSSLLGKVAVGNFNYRTTSVALNVVGTGVSDCSVSGQPSCYGQGFLEYDLEHQAFSVPISDQQNQTRCFGFGIGHIFGGKALATERFLTTPLGSADQELISQPSITKNELAGRPLSGSYRLRVYDNPALVWGSVEDIQIALSYRYWSAVDRSAK